MPGEFPTSRLEAGDRFYLTSKTQVEVVEVLNTDPRSPWEGTVRSVKTGRVHRNPVRLSGSRSRVDLLANRNRLDCLTLPFWSGGTGGGDDDPQSFLDHYAEPLDIPLTADGQAFLQASFVPPGCSRADGTITIGWTFYRLTVLIPSARTEGGLATMGGHSFKRWGRQQWDVAIQRLTVVDALSDGGLSAAGRELVAQLSQNPVVDEERAWVRALAAHLRRPLTRELEDAVLVIAPKWKDSVAELFDVADAAFRPAAIG